MVFKGTYTRTYTINRETKKLTVIVKLQQREGLIKPKENLYYGTATVNGKEFSHPALSHSVNAKYTAENIGNELINTYRNQAKIDKKSFRLKRN